MLATDLFAIRSEVACLAPTDPERRLHQRNHFAFGLTLNDDELDFHGHRPDRERSTARDWRTTVSRVGLNPSASDQEMTDRAVSHIANAMRPSWQWKRPRTEASSMRDVRPLAMASYPSPRLANSGSTSLARNSARQSELRLNLGNLPSRW